MNLAEANALAKEAETLGYTTEIKRLIGGSYRVYLTRTDGRWTFLTSEEDLEDVQARNDLWNSGPYQPRPLGFYDSDYNPLDPGSGWKGL